MPRNVLVPGADNRTYLGDFSSCSSAVSTASSYYGQVNGYYFCSGSCHTG